MSALKPSRRVLLFLLFSAAFLVSAVSLSACENTYQGIGQDIDNEEMKDGWD